MNKLDKNINELKHAGVKLQKQSAILLGERRGTQARYKELLGKLSDLEVLGEQDTSEAKKVRKEANALRGRIKELDEKIDIPREPEIIEVIRRNPDSELGKLAAQTATSAEEEFRKIRAEIAKVHLDFTKTGEQYVELSRQLGDAYRRLYETAQQMQRLNEYLPKRLSYDLPKPPRYSEIESAGEAASKAFGNRPSRALMKL